MAGSDWVKMRTDLYRNPKVCMMADLLSHHEGDLARYVSQNTQCSMTVTRNVMRNVTVGALVSVWGVLRHQGKREGDDLVVRGCTIHVIDDIADLPGFGDAMVSVGWAMETPEGFILPRFFDGHNADPDEIARKKNAERQKRFRNNSNVTRNVTGNVTVTHRIEENREEIYRGMNSPMTPSCTETENPSPVLASPDPNPESESPVAEPALPAEPPLMTFPCDGKEKSWVLTRKILDEFAAAYPSLDVMGECRKALLWVNATPDRRKTARGMMRFLANWLARAQERARPSRDSPLVGEVTRKPTLEERIDEAFRRVST